MAPSTSHRTLEGPDASAAPGSDRPELTVVMPCLDEAETLGICIDKAQRSLEALGVRAEVLVADNGSRDGSQAIATEAGARVVDVAERGYGAALQAGIAAARGEFVIMGDADDSYDFSALGPFVAGLREGNDLVAGNRFAGGIAPGAMPWLHKLGNPVLTRLARRFFRSPAGDIYCGLRGFRRDAILGLDLRSTGMEFAIEMVVKASLTGLRIAEVPTTLSPDGRTRKPHLRTWRDGWRSLRFLLMYSPNWLFFYPGLVLGFLGGLGMIWGLAARSSPGALVLCSVAAGIGVSSVLFAAFAKTFAISEGLLPPESRLMRLFGVITLEVGLLAGAVVVLAGVILTAVALTVNDAGDPRVRMLIVAGTLLSVGAQTVLASFFLSILGLRRVGNPVSD